MFLEKIQFIMLPPLIGGGIKRCCLTSVCLSAAYIGPKLRTERPRKTEIGSSPRHTWLGHHFQGQRSRSPGRFTHRGVNASGSCSGERGNVLLRCSLHSTGAVGSAARGASAPAVGDGRGHIVAAALLQLVTGKHASSKKLNCKIRRYLI